MWTKLIDMAWMQNDRVSRSAFLFFITTGLTIVVTFTYFAVWCWLVFLATFMGTPVDLPPSVAQMGLILMGGSGMGVGLAGANYAYKRSQDVKLKINKVLDPGTD